MRDHGRKRKDEGKKGARISPPAGQDETHACDPMVFPCPYGYPPVQHPPCLPLSLRLLPRLAAAATITTTTSSSSLNFVSIPSFLLVSFFSFFSLRSIHLPRSPEMKSVHFSQPLWNSVKRGRPKRMGGQDTDEITESRKSK